MASFQYLLVLASLLTTGVLSAWIPNQTCRNDNGISYVGNARHSNCVPWATIPWVKIFTFADSAEEAGNYCRAPLTPGTKPEDAKFFCITSFTKGKPSFDMMPCDTLVPLCTGNEPSSKDQATVVQGQASSRRQAAPANSFNQPDNPKTFQGNNNVDQSFACPAGNPGHTLCLNRGNACEAPTPLTAAEIQTAVDGHNKYRIMVAKGQARGRFTVGPANNMIKFTWDPEAAAIAQRWADQCGTRVGHDCADCRKTQNPDPGLYNTQDYSLGQNIYTGWDSASTPSNTEALVTAMEKWYAETSDVQDLATLQQSYKIEGGPMTGHFTQMVWGSTYAVGCGISRYPSQGMNTIQVVCNYRRQGNMMGQPVYEPSTTGQPQCTKDNLSLDSSTGLCIKNN